MLIVGFWIDYHLLFVNITHITKRFILLNMLFIFSISFAPFVTAFAGKHFRDAFAVALLSATYCIMNFFFMLIFIYAKSKNLTDPAFWKASKGNRLIFRHRGLCYPRRYSPGLCKHFYFLRHLPDHFRLAPDEEEMVLGEMYPKIHILGYPRSRSCLYA